MSNDSDESAWFRPENAETAYRAAQKGLKPEMPRRFWRETGLREIDGVYQLTLDGRPARTPAKRALAASTRALGQALADEWEAQREHLDPTTMPLTRLLNAAIDGVADARDEVHAEIVRYAGTDLLCYLAHEPDSLVARQRAAWDPVLDWAAETIGARLEPTAGVVHRSQSPEALAAVSAAIDTSDAAKLAALSVITTLTGSALLALAVARGRLEAEHAWVAAHVDEDHQIELWGQDEEAALRRAFRWREMEAAARVMQFG